MSRVHSESDNVQRDDDAPSVTLTRGELRQLVTNAVADALCDQQPAQPAPELVDRRGLARALFVSLSSVDRLAREGCPCVRVCDSPRFEVAAVIDWLKARAAGGPTHAIQGGKGR